MQLARLPCAPYVIVHGGLAHADDVDGDCNANVGIMTRTMSISTVRPVTNSGTGSENRPGITVLGGFLSVAY